MSSVAAGIALATRKVEQGSAEGFAVSYGKDAKPEGSKTLAESAALRVAGKMLATLNFGVASHAEVRERLTATAEWMAVAARENVLVRAMLTGCWSERLPSPTLSAVPSSSAVRRFATGRIRRCPMPPTASAGRSGRGTLS